MKPKMLLPPMVWLQNNGYAALYECIHKHRQAFAHIPRSKPKKTKYDRVLVMVRRARTIERLEGYVPSPYYVEFVLREKLLAKAMKDNRGAFEGILVDWEGGLRITIAWANYLADMNGGTLPSDDVINKHNSFVLFRMKDHPHLFKHLKRAA